MDEPGIYTKPLHLLQESWVDFELRVSLELLSNLKQELEKLSGGLLKERIHKSRVAIRRWFSVWGLLVEDGFEKKKFRRKVIRPLKAFLRELGDLRDCDVNIEKARELGCDRKTMEALKKLRKKLKARVKRTFKRLKPASMLARIECFLNERAEDLKEELESNPEPDQSAFAHFDRYLKAHEENVRIILKEASSAETLHKLRLAVKKWRYLLTECMGLTNLELVRSQTLLGEIHDFDRLEPVLIHEHNKGDELAVRRLHERRQALLAEFEKLKAELPFGLRPGSYSYASDGQKLLLK